MQHIIKFILNGEYTEAMTSDNTTLLDFIRETLGLTGTKKNCSNFSICRLDRRGMATLYSGANDIGQGLDTVMQVCAAEELGLDQKEVKICVADTNLSPFDTGTLMAGDEG